MCVCCAHILHMRIVPKFIIRRLIAILVHPYMHRKELFSVFHCVHKWLEPFDENAMLRIPPHIRDELALAILLLPVVVGNLRWPVSIRITATDATPSAGGTVACNVSQELAEKPLLVI